MLSSLYTTLTHPLQACHGYFHQKATPPANNDHPQLLTQHRRCPHISQLSLPSTQTSHLLTLLPPEIRLQILAHVLGNNTFRLIHAVNRISLNRSGEAAPWYRKPAPFNPLLTCRQLYAEGIDLLYSRNTFVISHPGALIRLHDCCLIPRRFETIRMLELHWRNRAGASCLPVGQGWERCWWLVTHEMQLRELTLRLEVSADVCVSGEFLSVDAEWVQPMLEMQGVERVLLDIRPMAMSPRVWRPIDDFREALVEVLKRNGNRVEALKEMDERE